MHDPAQYKDEHSGDESKAIPAQQAIETIKQMPYARIPDSPKAMKSRLTPAIDESPLQDEELTRIWIISSEDEVLIVAVIESTL